MRKLFEVFFSCLLVCASMASAQAKGGNSLTHVTIIDVNNGSELRNQTVAIQDARIASINPTTDSDKDLPGAMDAHGAFLIPGLWDMHVHVHDADELPLYVANGVTGVRIMSGQRDESRFRTYLARRTPAPETYLASAIVDGYPPVWPGSIVITN